MNADEFVQSMQSLGTRYLEEYTRALQRYADLFNSVSQPGRGNLGLGDIGDASEIQKRYSDFIVSQSPKVLAQLSEASINYYSTLADLGLQTLNGYVDSVLHTVESSQQQATEAATSEQAALLFHGIRGQSASNAFLISNNRDEAIDVEFDIAEVVSQDNGQKFKPKAKFTPRKCRLAANSERVVQCTLPLSEKFDAAQSYDGSIAVVGFPEMAIRISVQVEENTEPRSTEGRARKTAARKKTARKKATPKKAAKKASPKKTKK